MIRQPIVMTELCICTQPFPGSEGEVYISLSINGADGTVCRADTVNDADSGLMSFNRLLYTSNGLALFGNHTIRKYPDVAIVCRFVVP